MKTRRPLTLAVLALLLAFWMSAAFCTPYSAIDDLQWGLEEGLHWWLEAIPNGRYAGNMFSVVLCRWPAAKLLIMGPSMFLIPTLAAWLAVRGNRRGFLPALLFCHAAVLTVPLGMWQTIYGWVAGFSIYGLSTLFFLIWLLALRRAEEERRRPWLWAVPLFSLTLALGMFVENLTLLLLGACLILAFCSLGDRALRPPFLACLLGAVLAAIPMLFNGVVLEVLDSGSAIQHMRELSFSPEEGLAAALAQIAGQYFTQLLPFPLSSGLCAVLPLALLTACAYWNGPLRPLSMLGVLPLIFSLLAVQAGSWKAPGLPVLAVLCWLTPVPALLVQRESWRIRWGRLLLYLSAPLSLLPLALTTTTGFRVSFFPVVMLIAAAADSALPLLRRPASAALSAAGLALLLLLWSGLLTRNLACTQLREQLIQEAIQTGQDTLYLPTGLSRYETCYPRNPWFDETADAFRRFYRLPEGITLVVLWGGSFEAWPDIPPEIWENRVAYLPYVDFEPLLPY